jgi:hypothetical protein
MYAVLARHVATCDVDSALTIGASTARRRSFVKPTPDTGYDRILVPAASSASPMRQAI